MSVPLRRVVAYCLDVAILFVVLAPVGYLVNLALGAERFFWDGGVDGKSSELLGTGVALFHTQ
jgi:hypothetical protein